MRRHTRACRPGSCASERHCCAALPTGPEPEGVGSLALKDTKTSTALQLTLRSADNIATVALVAAIANREGLCMTPVTRHVNSVAGALATATVVSLALLLGCAIRAVAAPIVVDPNPVPCVATTAHYTTIQSAVSAAPPGATIQVCPGTYAEKVTIATPLTLRGVTNSAANTAAAVVAIPSGTFKSGFTQIDIKAAGVNLDDIGVDGSNTVSGCTFGTLVGILFDSGSSGSLQQVALRNHNISDGSGGYCNESAASGIAVSSTSATSVTITFRNNDISGTVNGVYLFIQPGNTVSNNTITDAAVGVYGASGNTLSGNVYRTVTNLTN